jgi:signal transduction histidine kinase
MAAERRRDWPRHRRRRGTVRIRTTLAATAILALALLVGGTAMLTLLRRSLVRNLDDVADIRADDISALVAEEPLPRTLALEDDAVGQVVDEHGVVVAASPNIRGAGPIADIYPPGVDPVTRTVADLPEVDGSYRLLAQRATSPDGPVTIYVGTNLEPVHDTLVVVRASLLIAAPLLLALVAFVTWAAVGRALMPVEAIRSQVAELSNRDLGRRVPVPPGGDEIGRLATTMNAMLSRLQAAADRQARFVADASHELQSPLAAARTDLEVALAHPQATCWTATARDLLDEHRHMERLVADLLFIARADSGSPPSTPPSPVDLHEVVLEEVARVNGGDSVHIDTGRVHSAVVRGRPGDLRRAVRNLLDNARRHARTTVTVGLQDDGDTASLAVEDDGPGVPQQDRDRIFERFTRLDDGRSRATGGTGLGLAIVKEIVDQHHGQVNVRDRPDRAAGARFIVTLPSS